MQALDLDGDGELFEDEVTDATASLLLLDVDGDGAVSPDELTPPREERPRMGRGGFGRGRGGAREGSAPEPSELSFEDGVAEVPDRETFKRLSYQGAEVMVDTHLAGLEFVKFQISLVDPAQPRLYFMNTKTHRAHPMFMSKIGLPHRGQMRGVLVYRPRLQAPSGEPGLYTFEFEPNDAYPFDSIKLAYDLLTARSQALAGRLAYNLLPRAKQQYLRETERYAAAKLPLYDEANDDSLTVAFLALNAAEGYGRLRLLESGQRPSPTDVVVCPTLPNEMSRVAGVITSVRQTPLSHVNLRAVQDRVPNAFVANAHGLPQVKALLGKYVHYTVTSDGYELREVTADAVAKHHADLRPSQPQVPTSDLSRNEVRPFRAIRFEDWTSVGVKAANLAVLGQLDLPGAEVPQGYAVPFAYYDAFMRHNGLYASARAMLADEAFQADPEARKEALKWLRKQIRAGDMPPAIRDMLGRAHAAFPAGTSLRCRSSTNNEDLPGFSGAGLYDSFTHRPDEGHLSKSIKQVYASLWNLRAFEAREFYRIDHFATYMGVAVHPNFKDEQVNGVAVSDDVLAVAQSDGPVLYYVNAQLGEDMVTNPEERSAPEELLIGPRNPRVDKVLQRSSLVRGDAPVLSAEHLLGLRRSLRVIHSRFAALYQVQPGAPFAMEIEFKVTAEGKLAIKQARPWVYPSK